MAMKLNDFETDYYGQGFLPPVSAAPASTPQAAPTNSTSNIDALTQQILGQNTTSKWSGGYSADAATKDMARILDSIGITDIRQFGKITKTGINETVTSDGRGGFVDKNGNPVDPKLVTSQMAGESEGGYYTEYTAPIGTKEVFGNKITKQEVPNTYSERQTGNAFGGTFEGKGNTGYRVDFAPDGTPVFYTTGASSSDVADLMPIIQLGLMATGAGGLLGNAILGAGANQVAAGALGGALLGGGTAALSGGDILKGALLGGAGGALSGYLNPATGEISATPTEGSIPVSSDDIATLGGGAVMSGTGLTAGGSGLGLNPAASGLNTIAVDGGLTNTGILSGSSLGTELLGTGTGLAGLTGTGILSGSELGTALLGTTSTTPLVGTGILSGSSLGSELLGTGANTAATVGGLTGLTNAANVGYGALDTGISTGLTGLGSDALSTGINPSGATTGVPDTTGVMPADTGSFSNITPAQLSSLLNGALGLFGAAGLSKMGGSGGGGSPMNVGALPTQGVPLYSQDYFNAIQQNYNTLMPAMPKDVATPLANWYNSQYGA